LEDITLTVQNWHQKHQTYHIINDVVLIYGHNKN
jgi:hypothetical protein